MEAMTRAEAWGVLLLVLAGLTGFCVGAKDEEGFVDRFLLGTAIGCVFAMIAGLFGLVAVVVSSALSTLSR